MLQEFKAYIKREQLFKPHDKVLLTVSGGIDSVVMAELFHRCGFHFGIAHCNFQLRGEESDADEQFTAQLAKKYRVPFYSIQFPTTDYAEKHRLSIQMAARELRYNWFRELKNKENYTFIATAHHLDDQIETFFINLLRSSGISGFHGIMPISGDLIRPLLFASRKKIEQFATANKLSYREDKSNKEIKYIRNRIRKEIIPVFREISPEFISIMTENIERIRGAEKIYREKIEKEKKKLILPSKNRIAFSIEALKTLNPLPIYLFEFLNPFGFNFSMIQDMIRSLDDPPGKQFYSSSHRLVKDRKELIITPYQPEQKKREIKTDYSIAEETKKISVPVKLSFKMIIRDKKFSVDLSPETANLDFHKLQFPLLLRKWRKGDSFYPYGRNHRKKLSDFFTDSKLSIPEKENIWLLCSDDHIVWVVGYRIDNRYRVTPRTKEILLIYLQK